MAAANQVDKFPNSTLQKSVNDLASQTLKTQISAFKYENIDKAQEKSNQICDEIINKIKGIDNKNFKFIVSCLIVEKSNIGINLSASSYWDNNTDGSLAIKEESETALGIVNVFACSI